jgi:hypothetical protein
LLFVRVFKACFLTYYETTSYTKYKIRVNPWFQFDLQAVNSQSFSVLYSDKVAA